MSNEQWASFQRRKTTRFERVGGEECKMFQLNVRGDGSRQLCVGLDADQPLHKGLFKLIPLFRSLSGYLSTSRFHTCCLNGSKLLAAS